MSTPDFKANHPVVFRTFYSGFIAELEESRRHLKFINTWTKFRGGHFCGCHDILVRIKEVNLVAHFFNQLAMSGASSSLDHEH